MSSKMEITLKSATLPRRKTTKAEITLTGVKPSPETVAFKSEVEAKIDAFHPQKLRTQRSEVAFPVAAAVPHASRSSSLEPEGRPKAAPRERIIPIQVKIDTYLFCRHLVFVFNRWSKINFLFYNAHFFFFSLYDKMDFDIRKIRRWRQESSPSNTRRPRRPNRQCPRDQCLSDRALCRASRPPIRTQIAPSARL